MKYKILHTLLFAGLLAFLCCKQNDTISQQKAKNKFKKDLSEIRKDGKLKVLIAYSGTSYFLYRGEPMGFEYELLQRLADHLKLELEITISNNLDMLLKNLKKGKKYLVSYV